MANRGQPPEPLLSIYPVKGKGRSVRPVPTFMLFCHLEILNFTFKLVFGKSSPRGHPSKMERVHEQRRPAQISSPESCHPSHIELLGAPRTQSQWTHRVWGFGEPQSADKVKLSCPQPRKRGAGSPKRATFYVRTKTCFNASRRQCCCKNLK